MMKFTDLKQIVKHVVKAVSCPHCKAKYKEEHLHVVAVAPEEVLFYTTCSKCSTQVIINVSLMPENEKNSDKLSENLQIHTQLAPAISKDEFLDMKNFLTKFNGDFKNLFNETRTSS